MMKVKAIKIKYCFFAVTLLSAMVACSQDNEVGQPASGPAQTTQPAPSQPASNQAESAIDTRAEPVMEYVAVLQPTEGSEISGTVTFTDTEAGVAVNANVEGLPPTSAHGFHIHEFGDCSASDASSSGDHFNPDDQQHGAPDSQRRHVGDLGNLLSNGVGIAQTSVIDSRLSFSGENSIQGRAVVVHAEADDLQSQPAGEAGDPVACGVIELRS